MSFTNIPVLQPGGSPAPLLKYNRQYILEITGPQIPEPLEIKLPFTIEFDIERNNYSSVNRGTIKIYNLSLQHRNQIIHDQWDNADTSPQTLYITLQAGYGAGPNYPIILKGNATRAFSYRQGVNFITQIDVFDGGLAYDNAVSSHSFAAGTQISQVIDALVSDLTSVAPYGLSKGAVSNIVGNLSKGNTYTGSTISLLTELSNANFYIDNGTVNLVLASDAIGGNDVVISSQSGILGTPVKQSQWLTVELLFEPRLTVGSLINLQSIGVKDTNSGGYYYNGPHKVAAVSHRGIISPAVSGEAVTSLSLLAGTFNAISTSSNQ